MGSEVTLGVFLVVAIILALVVARRPEITASSGGRILAFASLALIPSLAATEGVLVHLEQSKSTEFCLTCHVMEPYGTSILTDDSEMIPAVHYRNKYVPRDSACYACHTQYAMFGDLKAKLSGVKHLYVNYLGTIPDTLATYEPYRNRECLHCHGDTPQFEKNEMHVDMLAELRDEEVSCLDCHDRIHR